MYNNEFSMKIKSKIDNDKFARSTIAAFIAPINPTIEEIQDIKTAVSEAITNCVVHAYDSSDNYITILVQILDKKVKISIKDEGKGIENVKKAREPFYTTKSEDERSGMGFTLMESFMDKVEVYSMINKGTEVVMTKLISGE